MHLTTLCFHAKINILAIFVCIFVFVVLRSPHRHRHDNRQHMAHIYGMPEGQVKPLVFLLDDKIQLLNRSG